jgi:signal peptidase I
MKTAVREVLVTLVLALIIFFAAQATIQTYVILMTCMEPNFYEGQRVVVNKAIYFFSDPQRGDVVIFKAPNGENEEFIKRVIGIPGDTVEVKNRAVYVNDVKLDEPYVKNPASYTLAELKVPKDSYFVLGDNRNTANDSHHGWFVPRDNMIGKAWLMTWPPGAWGVVPDYELDEQLAKAGA